MTTHFLEFFLDVVRPRLICHVQTFSENAIDFCDDICYNMLVSWEKKLNPNWQKGRKYYEQKNHRKS